MITNRLKTYFQEAHKHIELIEDSLSQYLSQKSSIKSME